MEGRKEGRGEERERKKNCKIPKCTVRVNGEGRKACYRMRRNVY
jgi:hypothetical protein